MGTTWSLSLIGPAALETVETRVQARLEAVVGQMSHWLAASDLCRFNAATGETWVELPDDLLRVVDQGLAIAEACDGAYDPTLGALVDLWGFGPAPPIHAPPSSEAIGSALTLCGYRRLKRRDHVLYQPGGLRLDLSSIAKGFAIDAVAAELLLSGCNSFLFELGGELYGKGLKPDGQPWWVAIELPPGAALAGLRLAALDVAVATSGDYRKGFIHQGRWYGHTLDPRTGWPVDNGLAQVTVVAASAMQADAQATAIYGLGVEQGLAYASRHNLTALLIETAAGGWREHATPSWKDLLTD